MASTDIPCIQAPAVVPFLYITKHPLNMRPYWVLFHTYIYHHQPLQKDNRLFLRKLSNFSRPMFGII